MKYHLVQMPCKTYIRKYALTMHGNPVRANGRTPLGCFINAALQKNIYNNRNLSESFIHKYYTDTLPISINQWQFDRIGFDFPPEKMHQINQFIEGLFEDHLFRWVDCGAQAGTQRKKLIEQFAALHNIETEIDITMEALIKMEYRLRKAVEDRRNVKAAIDLFNR